MGTLNLKVTGINHVVLYVSDMQRSMQFYVDLLGFENRNQTVGRDRNFLRCGAQGLDLFSSEGDIHPGEEMNHMALCFAGEDVDELIAEFAEAGIEASEKTRRNTFFISDPDGHRIEVLPSASYEMATTIGAITAATS